MTKSEHPQGSGAQYGQPQQPGQMPAQHNPAHQGIRAQVDVAGQMPTAQQMAPAPDSALAQPQVPTMEHGQPATQAPVQQQMAPVPQPPAGQVPPSYEYQAAPAPQPVAGQPMDAAPGQAPAPIDDYHYPQGQSGVPEAPSFAVPPAMAPAPVAQAMQAPASPPQQVGDGGYGDPSALGSSGEQISQRLAQLQSQYDNELAGETWNQPQNAEQVQPGSSFQAGQGYAGQQPPVDEFAAYPPLQVEEPQQQFNQQQPVSQTFQEQPAAYQQPLQAQEDQSALTGAPAYTPPPMAVPQNSYGDYNEGGEASTQHYGQDGQMQYDGPSIARETPSGGGLKKIMRGGAFVAALAVGGGAAYTYNFSDFFGADNASGSAPTIKAASSPIRILKQKITGAGASINKAVHNRLSGGGSNSSDSALGGGDKLLQNSSGGINALGSKVAGARSGLLPGFGSGSGFERSGPRRVKTLIVRPDGTILRPAGGAIGSNALRTAVSPGLNAASIPKVKKIAKSGGSQIRRMKTIGESSAARRLGGSSLNRLGNTASNSPTGQVIRKAKTIKKTKPVSRPVRSASVSAPVRGDIGSPFVVQVTSRSSQTSALAAFADMQQKYPSLLSPYAPDIQRADLGTKGIWYRLRVGPVGSKTAATDLCSSLKQAGHPGCFVRRK